MTSINSITAVTPSTVTGSALGGQQSQPTTSAAAVTAPVTAAPVKAANTNVLATTSRQIEDPLAGVLITQSVGTDGQVLNQFPSTVVVAYLREGLSANGSPVAQDGGSAQGTFA